MHLDSRSSNILDRYSTVFTATIADGTPEKSKTEAFRERKIDQLEKIQLRAVRLISKDRQLQNSQFPHGLLKKKKKKKKKNLFRKNR